MGSSPFRLRAAGVLLALSICGITFASTRGVIHAAGSLSPVLGVFCSAVLAYFTLATRDLHVETRKVLRCLEEGDLPRARRELSFLVGRDTAHLDEPEILRALVETIAENISDGVMAPLFYLGLGGPAWAMTYKAVNTLDSMVGYKNEPFRHIGWASAKLDDAVNFLPARLAGFLIVLASRAAGGSWRDSLRILWKDHGKHESPNSAWPEAAMAGALGVQLGGPVFRDGKFDPEPFMGDPVHRLEPGHIRQANALLFAMTIIAATVFALLRKGLLAIYH